MQSRLLFFSGRESLHHVLAERLAKALAAVERINGDNLLATPDRDALDGVLADFEVDIPTVDVEGQYSSSVRETKIDVTGDFRYSGFPGSRTMIDGSEVSLFLPVAGFGPALTHQASTHTMSPPQGDYRANEIVLTQTLPSHQVQSNAAIGDQVRRIVEHVGWASTAARRGTSSSASSCRRRSRPGSRSSLRTAILKRHLASTSHLGQIHLSSPSTWSRDAG